MAVAKKRRTRVAEHKKRRPAPRVIGPHSDAGQRAISQELVRVTLASKPARPELEV